MANDEYCDDSYLQAQQEQEHQLYLHELQTLGVKNEHSDNGTRNIRNREINKPTQYESSRYIANSSSKEATPF